VTTWALPLAGGFVYIYVFVGNKIINVTVIRISKMPALTAWRLAAILAVSSAGVSGQTAKKPNFIIFLMDDVRNNAALQRQLEMWANAQPDGRPVEYR